MPLSPDDLFARLEQLGIRTTTQTHPPVFTVGEAKAHRNDGGGGHLKNLFLRNKKGDVMWLVVADEDRTLDLKRLGGLLEAGNLSFASADRLMTYLGVSPGSVTPFAVVNDVELAVRVVLDASLLAHATLHAHPLTNEMTTAIATEDLLRFLRDTGHEPRVLELG